MPIYEYKCTSCGTLIEVIQKMGDPPLATCASCSGPLEKILSRTSFQLSGGGWASSGYAKGDAPSSKSAEPAGGGGAKEPKSTDGGGGAKEPGKTGGGGCGSGCGCH